MKGYDNVIIVNNGICG